jgi:hypothetical protein
LKETMRMPCGLTHREDPSDDAVLAGGVQALENEQKAPPRLRVESLLQDVEALVTLRQALLSSGLVEPEPASGISLAEPRRRPGLDDQRVDHGQKRRRG